MRGSPCGDFTLLDLFKQASSVWAIDAGESDNSPGEWACQEETFRLQETRPAKMLVLRRGVFINPFAVCLGIDRSTGGEEGTFGIDFLFIQSRIRFFKPST